MNSTSTVLWEPGRATAPATRHARREAAPRAELAEEVKALLPDGLIAMAAARITFSSPARRGRRTTRLPRGRAQHAVPASGDGGLT